MRLRLDDRVDFFSRTCIYCLLYNMIPESSVCIFNMNWIEKCLGRRAVCYRPALSKTVTIFMAVRNSVIKLNRQNCNNIWCFFNFNPFRTGFSFENVHTVLCCGTVTINEETCLPRYSIVSYTEVNTPELPENMFSLLVVDDDWMSFS